VTTVGARRALLLHPPVWNRRKIEAHVEALRGLLEKQGAKNSTVIGWKDEFDRHVRVMTAELIEAWMNDVVAGKHGDGGPAYHVFVAPVSLVAPVVAGEIGGLVRRALDAGRVEVIAWDPRTNVGLMVVGTRPMPLMSSMFLVLSDEEPAPPASTSAPPSGVDGTLEPEYTPPDSRGGST